MKIGAIAFLETTKGIEICLVSSRRHDGTQTLPKGYCKEHENLPKAALRELYEEAGILGRVNYKSRPILYSSKNNAADEVLYFFVETIKIASDWPEKKQRNRIFVTLEEAVELKTSKAARKILKELALYQSLKETASDSEAGLVQTFYPRLKDLFKSFAA